jgi:PAS domain S-box-containing protein
LRLSRLVAAGAVLLGVLAWILDALVDYLIFYPGSFVELLIIDVPPHELWVRTVLLVLCLGLGGLLAWTLHRREQEQQRRQQDRERLEQLRSILNRTPAVAITWLPGNGWPVQFVSESIRQFGYEPEQFISGEIDFVEIVNSDDVRRVTADFGSLVDSGRDEFSHEYRIVTADGEERWIDDRTRVVRDEEGKAECFDAILIDITARKRAEEALRQSEERYRQLVQNANDIIYTLSPDGEMLSVDGAVKRILGYEPEELEGKQVAEVFGEERAEAARSHYLEKLEDARASGTYEFELTDREGEPLVLEINTTIIRGDGEPVEVIGIARDITARKRTEEELQRRTRMLGERVKEMRCLYHVARISEDHARALDGVLQEIADLLSVSWQWPQITTARIELRGDAWEAGAAQGPPVAAQSAEITIRDEAVGRVEVRYHQQRPDADEGPFIAEERALIDAVAASIGEMVEHREAERERDALARFPAENPMPVLRVREDGVVDYANEAAANLLEKLGSGAGDFAPAGWLGRLERSIATQRSCRMEVTADEQVFAFTCAPIPELGYVNLYGMDITGRHEARQALLESEQRFRRAIEEAPLPVMLHAEGGEILTVNRLWREITGYSPSDIPTVGEWAQLAYGERRREVRTGIEKLYDLDHAVDEGEFEVRTADGETRIWHFHSAPLGKLADGRRTVISMANDVTARKSAEEALRESERRYRTVFENTGAATCLVGADRIIFLANEGFAELAGASREQIEGNIDFTELIAEHELERMTRYHEARRTPGREAPTRYEFDFVTLDGETRRVVMYIDLIPATETSVASLVDITQLRETQDELQQLTEELEERVERRTAELEAANDELEAFAYSVSHDLRAPLRSIDGFSQAVVEDYAEQLDETGKDYLRRVRKASQRMGELIDDMLQLSRITRAKLEQDRVDLSALAVQIIDELRAGEPDRSVEVEIEPDMTAEGDRTLLRVLLQNLLSNAWKFTANTDPARIRFFSETSDAGETVFTVADNGAGFDMAYQNKLFQPFQRLHRDDQFPGTGVGLATVRRVVNRHGGEVCGEGEVGEGARFSFTLPQAPDRNDETGGRDDG